MCDCICTTLPKCMRPYFEFGTSVVLKMPYNFASESSKDYQVVTLLFRWFFFFFGCKLLRYPRTAAHPSLIKIPLPHWYSHPSA